MGQPAVWCCVVLERLSARCFMPTAARSHGRRGRAMIAKRPVIEVFDAKTIARLKKTLPTTDGEPMDSDWHRAAMNLLIELMICFYGARKDYFCSGNMFIHFFLPKTRR